LSSNKLCDDCRKKPAVIKAGFLNKKLCLDCYLSELEKKVKRNISALKIREVAQNVFVPLHPIFPLSSILLYRIVDRIERRFQKKPFLLVIENFWPTTSISVSLDNIYSFKLSESVMKTLLEKKKRGLVDYWRALRAVYIALTKSYHSAFIVMPGCSDFLAFLDLYSFITGVERSNENIPVTSFVSDEGPGVVNGFYGVPCREVVAAGYLFFKDNPPNFNQQEQFLLTKTESIVYRMLLDAVKERSYEALINIEKTFLFMASSLEYKKCRYCRGASREDVCTFCKELEGKI